MLLLPARVVHNEIGRFFIICLSTVAMQSARICNYVKMYAHGYLYTRRFVAHDKRFIWQRVNISFRRHNSYNEASMNSRRRGAVFEKNNNYVFEFVSSLPFAHPQM